MSFLIGAALAQAAVPATVDYSKNDSWLCLPGRSDVCARPVTSVDLTPRGYGAVRTSRPAPKPAIDCFYVYPTVSRDRGLNSDLVMDEENGYTLAQLGPFAPVCRTFAPKYRQMTVGAIAAFAMGQDISKAGLISYGDVLAAWRDYLANRNQGRPFVLIGHSQGTLHLIQLIAREIEPNPAVAKRMKLAILPGFNVLVPQGKLVGGDFKSTPLCSKPGQTGCAIAWTRFREKNVPPAGPIFRLAAKPGLAA